MGRYWRPTFSSCNRRGQEAMPAYSYALYPNIPGVVQIHSKDFAHMNPRLAAVAGPLKGSVIGLSDDPVSIGRVKSNKIRLNSNSVSRRHCLIETQADNFKITDLGSQNGTHVNGVPVQVRALENGDQKNWSAQ